MDIQIRTAGIGKWPVVRAMGHDVTLNLFDDDFALVMRAVGVDPDADEEQAAEPA